MFTVAKVAEFLQMSKITIYDLIKTAKLKVYKIGHQYRVSFIIHSVRSSRCGWGSLTLPLYSSSYNTHSFKEHERSELLRAP
ncbi:helix-turn-helix domain-containing protein [Bacillus sp. 7705b]|uniref:helix-turn-helix domain-containing protein n=1 Tax=Bacillus sp. 7705b TaxID=2028568 RepID=UPI000BADDC15|nr:hypothetical protein CJU60_16670 [Bacillus sp. 7705b]